MAHTPCGGSMTSPLPVTCSVTLLSATMSVASSRRRNLSVRQSLASSTAALVSWPGYSSSLCSSLSKSVNASAVAPANPPTTASFDDGFWAEVSGATDCVALFVSDVSILRSLRTLCLTTSLPAVHCPSAARTTLSCLRTHKTVVVRTCSGPNPPVKGPKEPAAPPRSKPSRPDADADADAETPRPPRQRWRRLTKEEADSAMI
mmetsp:Transcript_2766/g.6195  ORF Transcript_2766/g.6195 Transcript_2766/m.6195 type:complete len:204 (-) Transcript_2766:37-648(-)